MSDDTLRAALRLMDEAIFDLPIGKDVTYSRGYSAGVAAARESLREALTALAASATDELPDREATPLIDPGLTASATDEPT